MKTLITGIKRVALALSLATPIVSWATPTATAVWRNNLGQSYTIGGVTYAFSAGAGTLNENGTITAPASFTANVPCIDLQNTGIQTISVLVKYSGLDIAQIYSDDTDAIGVGFASILDSDNNVVGACVRTADETNILRTYHAGSNASAATPLEVGETVAVEGTGYLLFSYKHDVGNRAYMGASIDTLAGGQDTNGHWSNRTLKKLAIGGDLSGKAWNGAGFKIEEVAVFVGSYLSNEDVADYVFPTVTVDPEITTMSALNTKVAALDNEFLYFTSAASVELDAEPSAATQTYLQSDNWKGTVLIKDVTKTDIVPTKYGNKNSTLKLSGVSGYFAKAQYTSAATPQIELENSATEGYDYGFKQTNGYSFNSNGGYSYVNTPKLKGSGTLWGSWNGKAFYVADDYSEFTGIVNLSGGDAVWLGVSLPATVSDVESEVIQKGIRLGGTIPANVASWTADRYDGTVRLTTAISNEDAYKGDFLQNSKWKGTCQLDWNPTGKLDIVNYGNANSVIEIPSTFSALPTRNGGADSANVASEVKITGSWTVSDGWDNKTTTFAKLSGGGTLTVNGTTSSSTAIPYTITRLEGFTGTLAGARGKFTIGTIVSSVEPTPGTKLVNCTTTYAPVLDSTVVTYGGNVQDVKLEFVTDDGIYVADPVVANITSADGETVTPYTDAATAFAAVQEGETLTLLADLELTETITVTNSFTLGGAVTVSSGSNSIGLQMSGATLTVTDDITITAFLMGGDADAQFVFPTTKYNQNAYKVKAGADFYMDASVNYDVVAAADEVAGTTTYKWVLRSTFIFDVTKNHSSVTYEGGAAVTRRTDVAANEVIEFFVTPEANYTVKSVVAETDAGTTTLTPVEGKYSVTVTKNVVVTVNTAAAIPEATVYGKSFVLTQVGDSNVRTGSVTPEQPFDSVSAALDVITIKTAAGNDVTGGYNISAELSDGNITATYTVTLKDVDFSGAETLWTDAEEGKVVLNAAVVEGLYYGVTADGSISSTLTTKPTLTEATAENKATILKADKQTGDAGFYKVWVSDEQ